MTTASFDLADLNGRNGLALNGIDEGDFSGTSVSGAGDINGDGIDDLIIGADSADPNDNNFTGQSYVVFGSKKRFPSSLELSALDGSNGFTLNGINEGDATGRSVSKAGDINGDGIDDLIIGAAQASPNGDSSGESYVVFGNKEEFPSSLELSALDGSNGFTLNGIDEFDASGTSVSGAGDINGDGIDDLIIGSSQANPNSIAYAGQSYVVFGNKGEFPASLELSALDGHNGFALNGINQEDFAGFSVSGAGDINGDGTDDLIIGAPEADQTGQSYVVFGNEEGFPASFELSTLDGNNGFTLNGINSRDALGVSVSDAGDINGDGIDDLIIGAVNANPNGIAYAGQSYVVFGNEEGFPASLELSALDGNNGFVFNGTNDFDNLGDSVSRAGDINDDGIDDLIIGAQGADETGQSYVVFGSKEGFPPSLEPADLNGSNGFIFNGINEIDELGSSVSGAGDINNDGIDDLIIGAQAADPNGFESGQSYLVFGFNTIVGTSGLD